MDYRLNPDTLGEIFAVPSAVVDEHIKLAGSAQLKVLLWLLRSGRGAYDVARCSQSIGLSPADCNDALQYWFATGLLLTPPENSGAEKLGEEAPAMAHLENSVSSERPAPAAQKPVTFPAASHSPSKPLPAPPAARADVPPARPRAVKPQMKEVIARQKQSAEFSYLLDTASTRLGRPISHGDMETMLYLYDTAGLPVEVILMVIEYAIAAGKYHMRYIEKVALDWADRGLDTIAAAEQYLCALERRRQSWERVSAVLGLTQSPTMAQSDAAECWISDWQMDEGLLRMAYEKCMAATGKFNSGYMTKILEQWRADGVDSVEKALAERGSAKRYGKSKPKKETSFDLDEYENMVSSFTPVYKK